MNNLKVIVTADSASFKMGGEAARALIFFNILWANKVETFLVVHSRSKDELLDLYPHKKDYIYFINDTPVQKLLWVAAKRLPSRIRELFFAGLSSLISDFNSKRTIKALIKKHSIDIVHKVAPISPLLPSFLFGLGVPVIFGQLSGDMDFPPALAHKYDNIITRSIIWFGRKAALLANLIICGKKNASVLIVADQRTSRICAAIFKTPRKITLPDGGVDRQVWKYVTQYSKKSTIKIIHIGRLVDWKGADFLIEAFKKAHDIHSDTVLEIIGDGPLRCKLETQTKDLGIKNFVYFRGALSPAELNLYCAESDIFVMPSIREAGGNSVIEALATGLPVIAIDWGGPGESISSECGIKIKPISREYIIENIAKSLIFLIENAELRKQMGLAGRKRIEDGLYYWDVKIKRIINIYEELTRRSSP